MQGSFEVAAPNNCFGLARLLSVSKYCLPTENENDVQIALRIGSKYILKEVQLRINMLLDKASNLINVEEVGVIGRIISKSRFHKLWSKLNGLLE